MITKPTYFRLELCGKCSYCFCRANIKEHFHTGYCAALEKSITLLPLSIAKMMTIKLVVVCPLYTPDLDEKK